MVGKRTYIVQRQKEIVMTIVPDQEGPDWFEEIQPNDLQIFLQVALDG